MDKVYLRLLGGFALEYAGRPLPLIPGVGQSLLAYLATHSDRTHTRELLAGTFWPNEPESAARRRLSQTLWQLQTALQEADGGDLIITSASEIGIAPAALWVDVAEFDTLLASASRREDSLAEIADLEAAITMYRGDFLAGFYDEWSELERTRLRHAYLEGLSRLVALFKSQADYESSLSYARRLTLHDPLREEAHREVMRLCFLLGRSNEALSQYERCAQILHEELGAEPDPETQQLRANIAELRDKGERPFAPTADAPMLSASDVSLVGRERERREILRRLDAALLGRGGVLFVAGPSGIGKTRLLNEVADDAQWRGLSVLRVECREEGQLEAYGAVRDALESGLSRLRAEQLAALLHRLTLADLARVVPSIRDWLPGLPEAIPEDAEAGPGRLHRAIIQTLFALSDLNPIMVAVDDAQWADEASLGLLAELSPELASKPILLYMSHRDADARERSEVWSQLLEIDAGGQSTRLILKPFELDDATRFIEESLGVATVPPDTAEGLYLETGGNPLLLLETLRTWHVEARTTVLGQVPDSPAEPLPVSGGIAQVVSRRFAGLDESARAVLEASAVIGRVEDPAFIATVAGVDRETSLAAFDVLLRRDALVESGEGFEFTHHQIRSVTLETMEPERKTTLHGVVAAELERRQPERVETLALHFAEAGVDDKAAAYALLAGDRAYELAAFDGASRHYRMAADRSIGEDRFHALMKLEDALDVLGHRGEQREVLVAAQSEHADSPDLLWRRARLEGHEGNHQTALRFAEQAVDGSSGAPGPLRRRVLRTMGVLLSHSDQQAQAIPYLESAVELSAADPLQEASTLCDLGSVLVQAQMYDEAVQQLERALDIYGQVGDLFGTVETSGELAVVFMEHGDTERAVELYEAALGIARDVGYQRAVAVNLINLGNARYVLGDLAGALTTYEEATNLVEQMRDYRNAAFLRSNVAYVRHTMLGDDSGEADLQRSLEFFRSEEHPWGEAFCHDHLAAIAFGNGDVRRARRHIAAGLALLEDGANQYVEVNIRRTAAEIELAAGDAELAMDHVERALELAKAIGLSDMEPMLMSLHGIVAWELGQQDTAWTAVVEATRRLEAGSERPYLAWYRRYVVAGGLGEEADARESLHEAAASLDAALETLDEQTRAAAMEKVPEHRAIAEAMDRLEARTDIVALPSAQAPTGRPLRDDEWVEVMWTISEPGDLDISSAAARRRHRIARLTAEATAQGAAARVTDLAEALDVSVATVRRDIAASRADGVEIVTRRRH